MLRVGCLFFVGIFFLLCLLCSGLFGLSMLFTQPGFFLVATLLATLTAVPYGLLLLWLDRNEPEPLTLVLTAFLWGACVSTVISGEVNSGVAQLTYNMTGDPFIADFMTASFSAPFIEEITKGFAVLLLFMLFRKEFDNVLDGIIYGAIIGLGFAWFENITYYMSAAADGGLGGMLQNAWARGVVSASGGSHAAYTGLTGCGFGLMRVMRRGVLRWTMPPPSEWLTHDSNLVSNSAESADRNQHARSSQLERYSPTKAHAIACAFAVFEFDRRHDGVTDYVGTMRNA